MNAQEFCYWLQGRAELLPDQPPTAEEWKMIREHLALVSKESPLEYAPRTLPPATIPGYVPNAPSYGGPLWEWFPNRVWC